MAVFDPVLHTIVVELHIDANGYGYMVQEVHHLSGWIQEIRVPISPRNKEYKELLWGSDYD